MGRAVIRSLIAAGIGLVALLSLLVLGNLTERFLEPSVDRVTFHGRRQSLTSTTTSQSDTTRNAEPAPCRTVT